MTDRRIIVQENGRVVLRGAVVDEEGIISTYQDEDEVLDYVIDWSRWLGIDTIASVVRETDNGITINDPVASNTTTTTTVWVRTVKGFGEVTTRVTTTAGRVKELTLRIYERDSSGPRYRRDYGWAH